MCSNVYDNVIYFEVCGFTKNTKLLISWERYIISSYNVKIHSLFIKVYYTVKNSCFSGGNL